MHLQRLYRPVGGHELKLIQQAGYKAFPPRFDWQPYFYPVLNEQYAIEIASKWNTKDEASAYVGYVTTFQLTADYLAQFEIKNVGAAHHNEMWVPSDELEQFNQQLLGQIEILHTFEGDTESK